MKISCKIVEDLLPLYVDGVCSEESKNAVEEHLSECRQCAETFEKMKLDCISQENMDVNLQEAEPLRKLSEKWNRQLFVAMVQGVLSTLVAVSGLLLLAYIFVGFRLG